MKYSAQKLNVVHIAMPQKCLPLIFWCTLFHIPFSCTCQRVWGWVANTWGICVCLYKNKIKLYIIPLIGCTIIYLNILPSISFSLFADLHCYKQW